jgi:hypothetical protein
MPAPRRFDTARRAIPASRQSTLHHGSTSLAFVGIASDAWIDTGDREQEF